MRICLDAKDVQIFAPVLFAVSFLIQYLLNFEERDLLNLASEVVSASVHEGVHWSIAFEQGCLNLGIQLDLWPSKFGTSNEVVFQAAFSTNWKAVVGEPAREVLDISLSWFLSA